MKKTAIVLFFLLCAAVLGGQQKKIKVVTDSANIHIEAHRTSTVIETVKKGTVLTLFETGRQEKAWYYVSYYSEEKWATITGFIEAVKVEPVGEGPQGAEADQTEAAAAVQEEKAKTETEQAVVAAEEQGAQVAAKAAVKETTAGQETTAEIKEIDEAAVAETAESDTERLVRVSGEAQVIGGSALLRALAGEEAKVLSLMPAGTPLELTGKKGEWYRVKYTQEKGVVTVGYVHQSMISLFPGDTLEQRAGQIDESAVETAKPTTPPDPEPALAEASRLEESDFQPEVGEREQGDGETPAQGFAGGILGGYALPSQSGYDGAFAFGFSLSYRITSNLEVEASGIRYQSGLEGHPEGLSRGKLTVFPFFLTVKGRYPLGERLAPYAVVGIGYYFNSFKLCDCIKNDWASLGFDVKEEVGNSLGFQVGAGCEYFVLPYLAVSLDVRYLLSNSKGSWSFVDQVSGGAVSGDIEDLNLNTLVLGLGVKFFFSIF